MVTMNCTICRELPENFTNLGDVLDYANTVTQVGGNSIFSIMILFAIFFVSFGVAPLGDSKRKLLFASFLTMSISIAMLMIGLIKPHILTIPLGVMILSLFLVYGTRGE